MTTNAQRAKSAMIALTSGTAMFCTYKWNSKVLSAINNKFDEW